MVLHGSVRRSGNRLRLTAQLIHIADGYHLWSDRFDRELTDVFAVQDEIATAIAARLEITLTGGDVVRAAPSTSAHVEAYELYLKGRLMLKARGRAVLEALELLNKSVELDPRSAPAYTALGEAYRQVGAFGLRPQSESLPKAKEALARALDLDPDFGEALGLLCEYRAHARPLLRGRIQELGARTDTRSIPFGDSSFLRGVRTMHNSR